MSDNQYNEVFNENEVNDNSVNDAEKKKAVKKPKDAELGNIQTLEFPNRTLPNLIEELLEKNFPVTLAKDGYMVGGFYGLGQDKGNKGFAFAQDTSEANCLVFYDNKNHKHLVRSFNDLVKFNNHVWGLFFKQSDDYKRPDAMWFPHLLEQGVLNIMPGSTK